MILNGVSYTCGSHIDTDVIIPARYLNTHDEKELGEKCFFDYDKNYAANQEQSKIVFADENFGCGSSREHAPIALKASGVKWVVAKSFARIFYRNAINIGLPVIEIDFEDLEIAKGDEIIVSLSLNTIENKSKNKSISVPEIPEFMQSIIKAGGLMSYLGGAQNGK